MPPARKPYLLRIDPELFAALQRWADDELRSVNGQIEFLLRRALAEAGRGPRTARKGSSARADRGEPGV
jgi:hypothetical protein